MHIRASELCRSDMIAYQCLGCSAASECQPMWVDILSPLYLYKSSGKVVLERSEVGKSCLRHYVASFAEEGKNARDIFCRRHEKTHAPSFVRDAHNVNISYTRASQANSWKLSGALVI